MEKVFAGGFVILISVSSYSSAILSVKENFLIVKDLRISVAGE